MLGGLQAIGSKSVLDMTTRCNGFVFAVTGVSVLELVNVLTDNVALYPVAPDKRQRLLHDFKLSEAWELIQHQKQPVFIIGLRLALLKTDLFRKKSYDHVYKNSHQGPQPSLVIGLSNDIKAHRVLMVHEVANPELGF